jgi:putative ABC transport system permease protein
VPTNLELAPGAAIQGFTIGVFTTLIFLLIPLLAIRKVSPARVFLREMPEVRGSRLKRLRRDPLPLIAGLIMLAGIAIAASWLAGSLRWGLIFLAALLACITVLAAGAKALLSVLKRLPPLGSLALRHGIKNLNRPGYHAAPVMATLGLGAAFILTVYFVQTSLISQIIRSAPADFPNVFLLGVAGNDKQAISEFLASCKDIESHRMIPSIPSRLVRINGRTADELALEPNERRYFKMEFTLTWSESVPPDTRIVEGEWWRAPNSSPLISVGENAAEHLKIGLNSILEFEVGGVPVRGTVANIRDPEFSRPGTSNQFIFSPGALDGLPASYIGAVRLPSSRVAEFQSSLFKRFPNVTSIDVGEVLTRVQDLLNKVSHIIRFVAFFAILSGIIILAASVVSTRYQRIREVVLLKTLGATRHQIAGIQAAEFLIVGSAAGFIGGILAAITAHLLLGRLLETEFDFQWFPIITAVAATAFLSIGTGWVSSRGVLNQKPLQILREN